MRLVAYACLLLAPLACFFLLQSQPANTGRPDAFAESLAEAGLSWQALTGEVSRAKMPKEEPRLSVLEDSPRALNFGKEKRGVRRALRDYFLSVGVRLFIHEDSWVEGVALRKQD